MIELGEMLGLIPNYERVLVLDASGNEVFNDYAFFVRTNLQQEMNVQKVKAIKARIEVYDPTIVDFDRCPKLTKDDVAEFKFKDLVTYKFTEIVLDGEDLWLD